MTLSRMILVVLVSAVVSGCSGPQAFVDRNYLTPGIRKQKLPGYDGFVTVCHDGDTPRETRDLLAREACEVYGLQPVLVQENRWQCRLTMPHRATYGCVDPAMRFDNGGYVNPFSPGQVELWQKQRAAAEPAPAATE